MVQISASIEYTNSTLSNLRATHEGQMYFDQALITEVEKVAP